MGEIKNASALQASDWRGLNRNQTQNAVAIKIVGHTRLYGGKPKGDKERIFDIDGISGALRRTDDKDPLKVAIPVITPDRVEKKQNEEHPGIFVQLAEDCIAYCVWYEKYECYIAIRKLTPRECFRLQGWGDEYFDRAAMVNSDSQLYKQAGNGVTVNVIHEIARKL